MSLVDERAREVAASYEFVGKGPKRGAVIEAIVLEQENITDC
jgi:hypothetical protein